MGKHQKITALALGVTITAAASIVGVQPVLAAPSIQTQINQVHNKQERQKNKLDQVKSKEAKALKEVQDLESQIADAEKKINSVKKQQEKTQEQVVQLKKQIIKTQNRINRRDQLLKDRVRLMYKNGSTVHFMEVVLGSQSFSDFLDRVYALHLIAKQDKQLLDAQKADKKKEEQDKAKIVKSLNELQNQLDSLKGLKEGLKNKTEKARSLLDQLKGKDSQIQKAIQSERAKVNGLLREQGSHHSATHHESHSNTTNVTYSAPSSSSNNLASGSVADMINASRRWIGNSVYVFGGGRTQAQIENGMFDCSGFVHWAFQQIGVNVGWTTSQLSHEGRAVSPSDMKPGDLVFFNTYKHNGHVGIYIGGGRFINCEDSYGVHIDSLSNSYWSSHFSGTVRRILN